MAANWWENDPSERYWVEIRSVPGTGRELWSPNRRTNGTRDPWYDLVAQVREGDVILHWHALEHRLVGESIAAHDAYEDFAQGLYRVPLQGFRPLVEDIGLPELRAVAPRLYEIRDELTERFGPPLRLPFQFKQDPTRFGFMSNYFAKIPRSMVDAVFGVGHDRRRPQRRAPGQAMPRPSFLRPFRPKADTAYRAKVKASVQVRRRDHETLVNACATWLANQGLEPQNNAAIDLGLSEPPVVIEAKVVGASWARVVREAVSQLYEYRYFKVADPKAALILLADKPVPPEWAGYLEHDRRVGMLWPVGDGDYHLSPLARRVLASARRVAGRTLS